MRMCFVYVYALLDYHMDSMVEYVRMESTRNYSILHKHTPSQTHTDTYDMYTNIPRYVQAYIQQTHTHTHTHVCARVPYTDLHTYSQHSIHTLLQSAQRDGHTLPYTHILNYHAPKHDYVPYTYTSPSPISNPYTYSSHYIHTYLPWDIHSVASILCMWGVHTDVYVYSQVYACMVLYVCMELLCTSTISIHKTYTMEMLRVLDELEYVPAHTQVYVSSWVDWQLKERHKGRYDV